MPPNEYRIEEDPKLFHSTKTQRGPLSENWIEEHKQQLAPLMCAYKLCKVEFRYWGMQAKIERFIHDTGEPGPAPVCRPRPCRAPPMAPPACLCPLGLQLDLQFCIPTLKPASGFPTLSGPPGNTCRAPTDRRQCAGRPQGSLEPCLPQTPDQSVFETCSVHSQCGDSPRGSLSAAQRPLLARGGSASASGPGAPGRSSRTAQRPCVRSKQASR